MSIKSYIKDFYKDMKSLDVGPVVTVLLATMAIIIAVGAFAAVFIGIMYAIYASLGYVLGILYAPAAVKLAELGLWGFILAVILLNWVLRIVSKPFRTVIIKAEKDGK